MRLFALSVLLILTGCASIQDLTHSSCTPSAKSGDVVLQREAYLYRVEGEAEISLRDYPRRFGQGVDETGRLAIHTPLALYTLPSGSHISIKRITRETHFDNPPNSIHVVGIAHLQGGDVPFVYVWGINNHVHFAPWESSAYDPRDNRSMQCK